MLSTCATPVFVQQHVLLWHRLWRHLEVDGPCCLVEREGLVVCQLDECRHLLHCLSHTGGDVVRNLSDQQQQQHAVSTKFIRGTCTCRSHRSDYKGWESNHPHGFCAAHKTTINCSNCRTPHSPRPDNAAAALAPPCLPVLRRCCCCRCFCSHALTSSNVSSRKKTMVVSIVPDMWALISSTDGSCKKCLATTRNSGTVAAATHRHGG